MIRFLQHHEINKVQWDKCIDEAKYSILYGYSWYLDVVSPGWHALIDSEYDTVFPLTWKKKYGLSYLTQPVFAQQLGVFSRHLLNEQKSQEFFKSIPGEFLHYDINMNPLNELSGQQLSCQLQVRKTYHIPLQTSYGEISARYTDDTKRNMKMSSKKNFLIKPVLLEDIIDLYQKNVWHKTPALKQSDFDNLIRLTDAVAQRKKVIMIGAFENNILNAGTLFFLTETKIIFIFGASSKTGRKNGAMRFIFDDIIRNNCNKDMVLDFEGSSVQSVEYFYKSFGSQKVTFLNVNFSKFGVLRNFILAKQHLTKMAARHKIKKLIQEMDKSKTVSYS